jgi:hypothetical protein
MNRSQNVKAPGASNTKGLKTNSYKLDPNIYQSYRKAISTQIALLALEGHAVYELADGGFWVCKLGFTHHAPDFESLQLFAKRLGLSK